MSRSWLVIGVSLGMVLSATLTSCDKPPVGPTPSPGGNTPPPGGNTPPPAPRVVRLQFEGPSTVAPDETVQFSVVALFSDGSNRVLANDPAASWQSSDPGILQIFPSGEATGRERGTVTISVSFAGVTGGKEVIVVPPGTFRVRGVIQDEGVPVSDAQVEITHGPAAGMAVTSSSRGEYALHGVSGDAEIRVKKGGYHDGRQRVFVARHEFVRFVMVPVRPHDNIEGTYTLVVTADEACRSRLSEEAMRRTYAAVVTQQQRNVTVRLDGAVFVTSRAGLLNRFFGISESDHVTFSLTDPRGTVPYWGEDPPDLAEYIPSSLPLYISGTVVASPTSAGKAGALAGTIGTMNAEFFPIVKCESARHRFELLRR